jgi:transcriptional regulator with XRE-family HTH domain
MQLTVRDVEELTGISRSVVVTTEIGKHEPLGESTLKLMCFYGLMVEDVLQDPPKPPKEIKETKERENNVDKTN